MAAIAGALSAALVRMVANLTVGKQGYEGVAEEIAAIERTASGLQARLLELADADARAYEGVVAAMRLPKGTDAERLERKDAMQSAYKGATDVPMETVRACLATLELARDVLQKGNRNAFTDAGVAALLAQAAMRGAGLNVRINLAAVADAPWRDERESELTDLLARSARLAHVVDDAINARL